MPEYHVYRMNDCDWWMATSADEARQDYLKEVGGERDPDACIDSDCPHQLTEAELDEENFRDNPDGCEEGEEPGTRTFREELERREKKSEMFAMTEY